MKKVKVLIDLYYYKFAISGIRSYISEFKNAIKEHGSSEIDYIFLEYSKKSNQSRLDIESKNRFQRLFVHFKYFIYKQIQIPVKLLFLKPKFLISLDFIAPVLSFNTKKITVVHDSLFWDHPKNYNFLWRKYFISMVNLGINSKTHLITTSKYSIKNLKRIFKKETKIAYAYQTFRNFKENFTIPNLPKKYILHVGTFDRRKGILTLLKAFQLLKRKDLKLVLVGAQVLNGDDTVFREIIGYIDENKLNENIILAGYVSDSKIASYYKNASLYVFPSVDEGFGIPIIEAMSYSLPIICSDIPVFREIGGNAVHYFDLGDEQSLAKNISLIMDSSKIRKKLINNGKKRIKDFSREKFIKVFENIILELGEK